MWAKKGRGMGLRGTRLGTDPSYSYPTPILLSHVTVSLLLLSDLNAVIDIHHSLLKVPHQLRSRRPGRCLR